MYAERTQPIHFWVPLMNAISVQNPLTLNIATRVQLETALSGPKKGD
jgi:hypothetical protein